MSDRQNPGAKKDETMAYTFGFVSSIILTLTAYLAVTNHLFVGKALVAFIVGLALVQLVVQLVCFLHLGREPKPYWNATVFVFMLGVLVIVVFGSLWIMYNLNYQMMPPQETDRAIMEDEGIYRHAEHD